MTGVELPGQSCFGHYRRLLANVECEVRRGFPRRDRFDKRTSIKVTIANCAHARSCYRRARGVRKTKSQDALWGFIYWWKLDNVLPYFLDRSIHDDCCCNAVHRRLTTR